MVAAPYINPPRDPPPPREDLHLPSLHQLSMDRLKSPPNSSLQLESFQAVQQRVPAEYAHPMLSTPFLCNSVAMPPPSTTINFHTQRVPSCIHQARIPRTARHDTRREGCDALCISNFISIISIAQAVMFLAFNTPERTILQTHLRETN